MVQVCSYKITFWLEASLSNSEITVGELEAGAVEFSDWPSLAAYLMRDAGDSGYVWRGQRNGNWGLISSLERAFTAGNFHDSERGGREQQGLSYFRAHAANYLDWVPSDNNIVEWLVAMQHYGCPTRLLDWTESPFVAIYFAYCDMRESETESGVLWQFDARLAINALQRQPDGSGLDFPNPRDSVTNEHFNSVSWSDQLNTLVREYIRTTTLIPLPISPVRPDARMTAQQTILTVDARLQGAIPYPLRTAALLPLIFKLQLPAEWRREVLRTLALMGITAASLFPGTAGVAKHAARIIEDGFRHVSSETEGH